MSSKSEKAYECILRKLPPALKRSTSFLRRARSGRKPIFRALHTTT